jgi:quinol monooxygenase YgiN
MWGKRQRADDWDSGRGNESEDRRDQRPDDRRAGGYWDEPGEWAASNGNRQGFGDQGFADDGRRGFGDDDRQGLGAPAWQPRRGRGNYGDAGPFGSEGAQAGEPGFGDPGHGEPGFGEQGFSEPAFGEQGFGQPRFSEPGFGEPAFGEQGFGEQGFSEQGFSEQGFGGARQDAWQGAPRRPMRDFPEAGFGQPGYGGRGGDFGPPDLDHRDLDHRDLDHREADGQWNDAGGWGPVEPEMSVPVFTPAGQVASPVPGAIATTGAGTRPYGRLSIFTLLDDRAAEFDQLAARAAEGVSMNEPDTLVYVMHVVPKAPMQRIIYEIYRDHAAFESHQRQPHTLEFEEGRRPCVLVTNIIDLRLKYAKVAPLQGVAPQPAGRPQPAARPQLPASPSQPGPGPRHRAQQLAGPDNGWFSESADGRPAADSDGSGWAADRSLGGGDRRSQDWGQPQYTGQRYRDN